jgi:hypothetical protein
LLDKVGKLHERLLPAEIAHLSRYGRGKAFVQDLKLSAATHRSQGDGLGHVGCQTEIIELVCQADSLTGNQLQEGAFEAVAVTPLASMGSFLGPPSGTIIRPPPLSESPGLSQSDRAQHFRSIWDDMGRLIDPLRDPPVAVSP